MGGVIYTNIITISVNSYSVTITNTNAISDFHLPFRIYAVHIDVES